MSLIVTGTVGLVIWIVLWGTSLARGFDAFLITLTLVVIALAARIIVPYLPGNRPAESTLGENARRR